MGKKDIYFFEKNGRLAVMGGRGAGGGGRMDKQALNSIQLGLGVSQSGLRGSQAGFTASQVGL